ncbi:MAG: VWA domain-containing protein [Methylacidiphilaceae bacterium]|nr:VWA domain-containing protein [Candidatus Methylacidiphilaceae bacterium]
MNPDDPKITALLLGEREILTPEEVEEWESLLAGNPEVKEIRRAVQLLQEGFAQEELHLGEEQRRRLEKAARNLFSLEKEKTLWPNRWVAWLPWRPQGPFLTPALAGLFFSLLVALVFVLFDPFPSPHSQERSGFADANRGVPVAAAERETKPNPAPASAAPASSIAAAAIPTPPPQAGNLVAGPVPSSSRPQALLPPDVRARSEKAAAPPSSSPARVAHAGSGGHARKRLAPSAQQTAEAEGMAVPWADGMAAATGACLMPMPLVSDLFQALEPGDPASAGNRNAVDALQENRFLLVYDHPLSTFSADVDTASYAIVRRYLLEGRTLPPKGAVRIEELINYFPYDYPGPTGDDPFSVSMESASCPWAPKHRLVRIGIKARELPREAVPPSNLVFLIDVSGSMAMPKKLPLLKKSLGYLVDRLGEKDQVGIVVYAGASGCVLLPTSDKRKIRHALAALEGGGSTNGASGIEMAYDLAEKNFLKEGNNRVILATDGDWNVGTTSQSELLALIAKKAKQKIYLTVLGFGMDNLNDSMLVKLADRGNGNYGYIDNLQEAHKVFGEDLHKTLYTVAKDVKFQVEFNPRKVSAHRLIGYEKRRLAKEDFNDDTKDAGEIGAGHTVTALYEIIPAEGRQPSHSEVDPLKYQPNSQETGGGGSSSVDPAASNELLTVKIRFKKPDEEKSQRLEFPFTDRGQEWESSSEEFRFAAAVAAFGQMLKKSPLRGESSWKLVRRLAQEGQGKDPYGYRSSFLALVERAGSLQPDSKEEEEMED